MKNERTFLQLMKQRKQLAEKSGNFGLRATECTYGQMAMDCDASGKNMKKNKEEE